jgi:hypothetical protein
MQKEDLIIYGASNYGMKVYLSLQNQYNILFFVDGDIKKQNSKLFNLNIYSPKVLSNYKDINIVIASSFFDEIFNNLLEMGVERILRFEESFYITSYKENDYFNRLKEHRTINLGEFLRDLEQIELKSLTFLPGGSGILDYAFLKALVNKFKIKNYLEIGTYIGESINIISESCESCYSITAPIEASFSMKNWCKNANIPDYSDRLSNAENIKHYYCDSKDFNYNKIDKKINLYFIDGDHSYKGVYLDTKNIFETRDDNSFVVWHDFKKQRNSLNGEIVKAVKDVLNEEFENVFITDNNLCGIYIPKEYQEFFPLRKIEYSEKRQDLYVYNTLIKPDINK